MSRQASGLVLRCREISAALARAEESIARLRAEFTSLSEAIVLIQGGEAVAAFVAHTGTRGDVLRTLLGILRTANGGMELRDLAARTMRALDMDADNPALVNIMVEKTRTALLRQEKAGVVRAERMGNRAALWGLAV